MQGKSLQEIHAPKSICFGCGPSNAEGLHIRSFESQAHDALVSAWTPKSHHEAFPGVLNGGIIGALLDCHSNWTAAWALMKRDKLEHPPCTVTAEFSVKLLRPTDSRSDVELHAIPVHVEGGRVVIEAKMSSKGKISATCRGTFVSVQEGHPAFYRW
jgi:acyl-coenzyme A thioesterase PaaI-like protein